MGSVDGGLIPSSVSKKCRNSLAVVKSPGDPAMCGFVA